MNILPLLSDSQLLTAQFVIGAISITFLFVGCMTKITGWLSRERKIRREMRRVRQHEEWKQAQQYIGWDGQGRPS